MEGYSRRGLRRQGQGLDVSACIEENDDKAGVVSSKEMGRKWFDGVCLMRAGELSTRMITVVEHRIDGEITLFET